MTAVSTDATWGAVTSQSASSQPGRCQWMPDTNGRILLPLFRVTREYSTLGINANRVGEPGFLSPPNCKVVAPLPLLRVCPGIPLKQI